MKVASGDSMFKMPVTGSQLGTRPNEAQGVGSTGERGIRKMTRSFHHGYEQVQLEWKLERGKKRM